MHKMDLLRFVNEEIIISNAFIHRQGKGKKNHENSFASFVEMSFSAHIFFICSSLTKLFLRSILRAALRHTGYMK